MEFFKHEMTTPYLFILMLDSFLTDQIWTSCCTGFLKRGKSHYIDRTLVLGNQGRFWLIFRSLVLVIFAQKFEWYFYACSLHTIIPKKVCKNTLFATEQLWRALDLENQVSCRKGQDFSPAINSYNYNSKTRERCFEILGILRPCC